MDLHSHTTASDGSLTPEQLVIQAARQGLRVLAITDHDTTEGLPPAMSEARRWDITIVPGVEISTISGPDEIHLLGYFVDLEDAALQALLARTRQARWDRARKMLARLADLGFPLEWERLSKIADGSASIGRPHVAATMLEAGYIDSFHEAFDLWIGRDRPAYVERYKLSPEEAIQLVRQSGGLPVLAHPYFCTRRGECTAALDLGRWLPKLRAAGLEGIESYYPRYTRSVNRHLLRLAIEHGLLITGGSDFHGGLLGHGLGSVDVPWAVWEGLERRHLLKGSIDRTQVEMRADRVPTLSPSRIAT